MIWQSGRVTEAKYSRLRVHADPQACALAILAFTNTTKIILYQQHLS